MARACWKTIVVLLSCVVFATGCKIEVAQDNNSNKTGNKKKVAATKPKVTKSNTTEPVTYQVRNSSTSTNNDPPRRDFKRDSSPRSLSGGSGGGGSSFGSTDFGSGSGSGSGGMRSNTGATQKVVSVINETLDLGPTLVIWVLDITDSSFSLSSSVNNEIRNLYDRLATKQPGADAAKGNDKFLNAIVPFASEVTYPMDAPANSKTDVASVMEKLKADKTDKEMTFTAIKGAVEKYLSFRTQKNYQVMVVVVTDEAGDDVEVADSLIPLLDKHAIPVYALGASAPFGKTSALAAMQQNSFMEKTNAAPTNKTRQGPESRHLEYVDIPSVTTDFRGGGASDTLDSGFGPFHLEYVCRGTGGAFLAASSIMSRFSSRGKGEDVMSKYAPEYLSEADYQAALNKNRAKMAIHKAATMKRVETMASPRMDFFKKSEADLAKVINEAQKPPAKVQPQILALYDILADGEKDRDKLTSPRWQASYDLAMGRIAALRAQVDGYNAMLALLKRKSSFQNESSNTWVLQPADSIDVDSTLAKMITKSQMYLKRVVDEHPGTPWAAMAERDLKTQLGWKWEER